MRTQVRVRTECGLRRSDAGPCTLHLHLHLRRLSPSPVVRVRKADRPPNEAAASLPFVWGSTETYAAVIGAHTSNTKA